MNPRQDARRTTVAYYSSQTLPIGRKPISTVMGLGGRRNLWVAMVAGGTLCLKAHEQDVVK